MDGLSACLCIMVVIGFPIYIRFVFSIAEVESDTRSKKFPILAVNLPLL